MKCQIYTKQHNLVNITRKFVSSKSVTTPKPKENVIYHALNHVCSGETCHTYI